MKKTVRWKIKQLIARRQKHKLKVLLREAETLQIMEMNVCIFQLEQGPMLGEDDDDMNVGLIPIDGATKFLEYQHKDLKAESFVDAIKLYVLKSDNWFVDAGCVVDNGNDTNFVPCRNEDQSFEMISESDDKMLMKCEE